MGDAWRNLRLGQVLDERHERCGERDLPVLSITKNNGIMLASDRFDRVISRNLVKYRVAPRGVIALDPMLLWSGTIGRQRIVDAGIVSPDYRVYVPRSEALPEFLEYAFKGHQMASQFKAGARGTNIRRNRISRSDFDALKISLPPLPEQRKIAAILSSVDEAIEKTQVVIDRAQVVKKGLMQELLTKGLPGRHKTFKQTEIGRIPESWELVEFGEVLVGKPANGIYKPSDQIGSGCLLLGMTAFGTGEVIDWAKCRRCMASSAEMDRLGLLEGDILITRVYARISGVGRAILVPRVPEYAVFESNMMRVRVDTQKSAPRFATWALALPSTRRFIEDRATLAAQASINRKVLHGLPIALPTLDEQREIIGILSATEERVETEVSARNLLERLKSALMSVLLTGELRVRPDPEPA